MCLGEIRSSSEQVEEFTTEILQSVNELNRIPTMMMDEKTILNGNENAQKSIILLQQNLEELTSALSKDMKNILSIAEEFELADQQIEKGFNKL